MKDGKWRKNKICNTVTDFEVMGATCCLANVLISNIVCSLHLTKLLFVCVLAVSSYEKRKSNSHFEIEKRVQECFDQNR